ncbi:Protein of unknown function [Pyronema omphalodes CBS 100304]|uniref:Uncharacterized protein n=1 Tax=Pyronema omphalodes (strain CBS 100304) TaxID=1076935 RepID=U4LUX5_PYROM|nr:Protein of unknown function [Pyronema omphalodes CBS 100304]
MSECVAIWILRKRNFFKGLAWLLYTLQHKSRQGLKVIFTSQKSP